MNGNHPSILVEFVDRYDELLTRKDQQAAIRKDAYEVLKDLKLPVGGIRQILADERKDPQTLVDRRESLKLAASLMGSTVYVEEFVDDGTDPYKKDTVAKADEQLDEIKGASQEIDRLSAEMSSIIAEAKEQKLPGKLIPTLVKIRRDPDKFRESHGLLATCLAEIGVQV